MVPKVVVSTPPACWTVQKKVVHVNCMAYGVGPKGRLGVPPPAQNSKSGFGHQIANFKPNGMASECSEIKHFPGRGRHVYSVDIIALCKLLQKHALP